MIIETKARKIGNSLGIIIPKEAVALLKVEEGTPVYFTEAPDGSLRITADNPEFARQMESFHSITRRYRNALKELAK